MTTIAFEVLGIPTPQGSKTRMPNGAMLDGKSPEARERHKNWRSAVADAARIEATRLPAPLDGPLHLTVHFRFAMPKSRPAAVRAFGRAWKTSAPDLDKLVRSTGDALTSSGLISDDARLVEITATKIEVANSWTGAAIHLEAIEAPNYGG